MDRLEGLCAAPAANAIRFGEGCDGIERLEARLTGRAFAPHRHDTYAIGVTLAGVQRFHYRGEQRQCLPGECHILHPDERHDGGAGSEAGFGYRIAYIDPALIQHALGGRPLPFVPGGVVRAKAIARTLLGAALDLDDPIDELRRIDIGVEIAGLLAALCGDTVHRKQALAMTALLRVRELIAADPSTLRPARDLERLAGHDRWTLARQFRAAFGTSPSRFRTMRQLDHARRLIMAGRPLADASLEAGFADQAHMTRRFSRTYGMTPGRWVAATATPAEHREVAPAMVGRGRSLMPSVTLTKAGCQASGVWPWRPGSVRATAGTGSCR